MGSPAMQPGYTVLSDSSIQFVLHRPEPRQAEVVGDFTDWTQRPLPMRREGQAESWVVRTPPLSTGLHFYKYRVDGRWEVDSAHPMGVPDGFGGWNSAFGVAPRPASLPRLPLRVAQPAHLSRSRSAAEVEAGGLWIVRLGGAGDRLAGGR